MKMPELLPDWETAGWKPFRDAWDERGLTWPPSTKQRRILWPAVRDFPDLVGEWVEEAPHETSQTYEIVAYVIARLEAERRRVAYLDDFTEEEADEWLRLEKGDPHHSKIPAQLREARLVGRGVPATSNGENPYRVFLHRKVAEMDEWLEVLKRTQEKAAASKRTSAADGD